MTDRRSPVLRTTADDDLFIRMDAALGVPVVNQMIWRLTSPPSAAELDRLAGRLRRGRIGRLLRRSGVPLVRDHWVSDGVRSGRLVTEDSAVASVDMMEWIDAAAAARFDLVRGPVWELRSAPLSDGGGIVSLAVAHAAGDGAAVLRAVRIALADVDGPAFEARSPTVAEQFSDAAGQAGAIVANLAGLAREAVTDLISGPPSSTDVSPPREPVTARSGRAVSPDPHTDPDDTRLAPLCVVSVATHRWKAVAAQRGGSSNTLFIGIVLGIVVASGRATHDDVVRISVPMSLRSDDDDRANATMGLSLDLPASAARDFDLGTIRTRSRQVYEARTARPGTFVRLAPVMQALGDRAVAALSRNATTPLALASNLGLVEDHLAGLGDASRVGGIVTRSSTQSVSVRRLRELRGGLAAWVNEAGGVTTVSIIGLDPDGLGRGALEEKVDAEFARWSLEPTRW